MKDNNIKGKSFNDNNTNVIITTLPAEIFTHSRNAFLGIIIVCHLSWNHNLYAVWFNMCYSPKTMISSCRGEYCESRMNHTGWLTWSNPTRLKNILTQRLFTKHLTSVKFVPLIAETVKPRHYMCCGNPLQNSIIVIQLQSHYLYSTFKYVKDEEWHRCTDKLGFKQAKRQGESNTAFIFKLASFVAQSYISLMYENGSNKRHCVSYSQQCEQCI